VDEPTLALGILLTSEGPIEGLAGVACVVVKLYLRISELAIFILFQFIDGLTLQRLKVILFVGRRSSISICLFGSLPRSLTAMIRSQRLLHTSTRACTEFIGPPDPVSNLRPVLYTNPPPEPAPTLRHPYSLGEFSGGAQDDDLQWRLQRQQLDAFNHSFWTDV